MQATLRRFTCDDMFRFNSVNLDVLTETVRTRLPRPASFPPAASTPVSAGCSIYVSGRVALRSHAYSLLRSRPWPVHDKFLPGLPRQLAGVPDRGGCAQRSNIRVQLSRSRFRVAMGDGGVNTSVCRGRACGLPSRICQECCRVPVRPVIGKAEGVGENWHGHVSAVSVAPQFRRLGIARVLMKELERISEHVYVDNLQMPCLPAARGVSVSLGRTARSDALSEIRV